MASLLTNPKLGNSGVSNLIKSASTIANEQANYNDQIAALEYANSAYTDEAFAKYQAYLQGRINTLTATGSITNASKALTLTKTVEGAMHSNISSSIQRENIQIMAGNAALPDKYNLIVNQYQRAFNNGDMTLAQTLMGQAYSVSQQIQYQAQQAANASAALAKANAGAARAAASANVSDEGERVSNLEKFLGSMVGTAKNLSERELNKYAADYANDPQVRHFMQTMGVNITNQQPNYWDLVAGVAGAVYTHKVLQAQAEASINPLVSRTYAMDAQNMLTGQYKFDTLAGKLSASEIQQAQQDPNMFSYDNTNGAYKRNTVIGYQYMNMTDASGVTKPQLVPTYSGIANSTQSNKIYFLTPQETTMMTKAGLTFGQNKSGTTGDGVLVQATENTPGWLQKILGKNGTANMFTDKNGFTVFAAGSSNDLSKSYYTLATDNKGLAGLYEHLPDGNTQLVGGDYGFAAQAVQLLINQGQQVQQQIAVAQAKAQEALRVQQVQAQAQFAQQQAALRVAPPAPAPRGTPPAQAIQRTFSPQAPTFNPQPASRSSTQILQPSAGALPSNVQGVPLSQPHLNGIRL